jgi:hypothetical protein
VTLVGFERDLDIVELLSTSLLVQATRAMTASGSQVGRYGRSRTRSFRQSFLAAYAGRIGERLRESVTDTESVADADAGGALLPVLATRDDAVREVVDAMFPKVTHKAIGVSNATGWAPGALPPTSQGSTSAPPSAIESGLDDRPVEDGSPASAVDPLPPCAAVRRGVAALFDRHLVLGGGCGFCVSPTEPGTPAGARVGRRAVGGVRAAV